MGVVIRREKKGKQGKTGMGAVLGKTNGFPQVEGHFRGSKNRAPERLLRGPEGEKDCQGVEDRTEWKEGRLSSFIEPWSMVCTQPNTKMQFFTQANQSEMESAWRFEASEVEAL